MASKESDSGASASAAVKPATQTKVAPVRKKTAAAMTEIKAAAETTATPPAPIAPTEAAQPQTTPQTTQAQTVEAQATKTPPAPKAIADKEPTIMTTTEKAQVLFTDFNERAKTVAEKSTKAVEEFNEFAKGNVEALVESSKITAKGLEKLGQDAAEYGRKSFESASAALKGMASVKSPTELFKLHSDYVRATFDAHVAETSKSTEALLKLAGDAAQPISNRFAVVAEKVKTVTPGA